MSAFPQFIGAHYATSAPVAGNEQLVNLFVQPLESPGSPSKFALFPTPGLMARATLPTSGGRGGFEHNGRLWVVYGDQLYEIDDNWGYTARGTIALSGPVGFATNGGGGDQLAIVGGGSVYSYDLTTNTLTTELTGSYTHLGFVNGYFLALGGGIVRVSDLLDGTNYDPTVFFTRSALPDDAIALLTDPYGYVQLLGAKTGESWYHQDSASNPFALDRSSSIEQGIAAIYSLKQAGQSKIWLSTNANGGYQVMRAQGFTPARISDHALEQQIATYGDVSDAIGETYEDQGHTFYELTFPSVPVTWVYHANTNRWHQRGTWISEDNRFTYFRPTHHVFAFTTHIRLDRESNVLYEERASYATDILDDAGSARPLVRERVCPAVGRRVYKVRMSAAIFTAIVNAYQQVRQSQNRKRRFFDSLGLLMQTGTAPVTGAAQDTSPVIMLQWSDDHGQTWGPEVQASLGTVGQYGLPVEWFGLGSCEVMS